MVAGGGLTEPDFDVSGAKPPGIVAGAFWEMGLRGCEGGVGNWIEELIVLAS